MILIFKYKFFCLFMELSASQADASHWCLSCSILGDLVLVPKKTFFFPWGVPLRQMTAKMSLALYLNTSFVFLNFSELRFDYFCWLNPEFTNVVLKQATNIFLSQLLVGWWCKVQGNLGASVSLRIGRPGLGGSNYGTNMWSGRKRPDGRDGSDGIFGPQFLLAKNYTATRRNW